MSNPNELEELRAEVAEMRQQLQAVTEKANRADDTLEISNLQRIYGYYVDKGQWDQAADPNGIRPLICLPETAPSKSPGAACTKGRIACANT